jgi:hypothetical protein
MSPMMKRISILLFFVFAFVSANYAQNDNSLDGWHLGGRLEGDVLAPLSIHSTTDNSIFLVNKKPSFGWAVGIEASYNFYKYFGVSIGLDYGTTTNFLFPTTMFIEYALDFKIPVNFEVHVPLKENWHFYSSVGLCFSNIGGGLEEGRLYTENHGVRAEIFISPNNIRKYHSVEQFWAQKPCKISIDALVKLGVYYTLPYKDLLRFGIVGNLGLFTKYTGVYNIYSVNSADNSETEFDKGYYNYRYNGFGIEVAYIHCFKKKTK